MPQTAPTIRFQSTLSQSGGSNKSSAGVELPKDAREKLGANSQNVAEGTFAGFPFRAPLEPEGKDALHLRMSEALLKAAGVRDGATVIVEITRVGDEPEVRMPADLEEALAASKQAKALWEDITPMARREWVRWIASAKQEETRARRIEVGIDKLLHGMRRPCCFPGLNFVTKGLVPPEDTWSALPGQKSKG